MMTADDRTNEKIMGKEVKLIPGMHKTRRESNYTPPKKKRKKHGKKR